MHQNGNTELSTAEVKILVSLPSQFSIKWVGLIWDKAQNLKLDASVYRGIPKSPFPQINSAEYEARNVMFSAKAVFAAIAKNGNGEVDGDWIIKYLPQLTERGIEIHLGLVGLDVADMSNIHAVGATVFPVAEKWLIFVFEELNKYTNKKL